MTGTSSQLKDNQIQKGRRLVVICILVNTILAVIKIMTGIVGHTYALVADGVESFLDIFSSSVVWGGLKIGLLPPDSNHPYGHGKAESLASMIVSVTLIGVALGIAIQSIYEILHPHLVPAFYTLFVLLGVIVIKEFLFHLEFKSSRLTNSLSLKVDAWHQRSDALTSLLAFFGISAALLGGQRYSSADDWAALLASGWIAFQGFRLLKLAISEIMDEAPPQEVEDSIRSIARRVVGVMDVEKCRVRKSGLGYFVEIHIEVKGDLSISRGHEIAHHVKDALSESSLGIIDTVVHIEPAKEKDASDRLAPLSF